MLLKLMLLLSVAGLTGLGWGAVRGAPPEVVRVRVPAERVPTWFPEGTELTGLPINQFEALVRAAREGSAKLQASGPPKLLRARHAARWDGGPLTGRTELRVSPSRSGPGEVSLDPWAPAIVMNSGNSSVARADDAGRLSIYVAARDDKATDSGSVVLNWQLQPRVGSQGKKFKLGLPASPLSELTLDLPQGWEPEGPTGLRQGPNPIGTSGRSQWSFLGPLGATELRLVRSDGSDDSPDSPRLWCSGLTRIEVGEATCVWTLDWAVAAGPWSPRVFTFDLDAGLELIGVTGSCVEEFRAGPAKAPVGAAPNQAPGSTRVTVRLRADSASTAPLPSPPQSAPASTPPRTVTVRAMARVPSEGAWVIPSARPLNAVWTGGTTSVRLDTSRVVRGVRPLAGRRTRAQASGPAGDLTLVFEAARPEPVAEIDFRKPRADAAATVDGRLFVGPGPPRFDCRLVWQVDHGRLLDLDFEMPRGWSAERVEVEGVNEAVPWHPDADANSDGGVHVRVAPPAGDWTERPLVVRVTAAADGSLGFAPFALPRVRPSAARASDEVWVARSESGVTLRPSRARGVAWLDPAGVEASSGFPAPPTADASRPALAWRWTADDGEVEIERLHDEPEPIGTTEIVATLSADRLRIDARLSVALRDEPPRRLAVGLNMPSVGPSAWHFLDETTGLELPGRLLDARGRADAGLPGEGAAWLLDLPASQRGRVGLIATYEGDWAGAGQIPLLALPRPFLARGTLLVLSTRNLRTSVEARRTRVLDPEATYDSIAPLWRRTGPGSDLSGEDAGLGLRRAHAFTYDAPDARVELRSQELAHEPVEGVIRDAVLTTFLNPGGTIRHRLTLRVSSDRSVPLAVTLPVGSTVERARRDNQVVSPTISAGTLIVPLHGGGAGGSGSSRSLVTIALDYTGRELGPGTVVSLTPGRPRFSFPCLALEWEIVAPEPWRVESWGRMLGPATPVKGAGSTLLRRLAPYLDVSAWVGKQSVRGLPQGTSLLRELDARVGGARPEELTLAEWFLRWDSGPWPVLIDRSSLSAAGWGPRSRVTPPRVESGSSGSSEASLRPFGLAVVAIGRVLVVTTEDASRALRRAGEGPSAGGWASTFAEAAAWGADASCRFESVARWREEFTPRLSASAESMPVASHGEGRVVHRFAAAGWPEAEAEVCLIDGGVYDSLGWVVAFAVLTTGLAGARLPRPVRAGLVTAYLSLGVLATATSPLRFLGAAQGLSGGAAALACFELGRGLPSLRRGFRARGTRQTSTYLRRIRSSLVTPIVPVVGLVATGLMTNWVFAQFTPGTTIVALLPYEGPPDLIRKPDRVVLRLADFEKLKTLARGPERSIASTARAITVAHRLTWRDRGAVIVESDFSLEIAGETPAVWTFPVEDARDISARLDGDELPVRVEAGGRRASVRLEVDAEDDPSPIHLVVRRTMAPTATESGAMIALEVNPVATARIDVAAHPDGLPAQFTGPRGSLDESVNGGRATGLIGPVSRLEVRWDKSGARGGPRPSGAVDAQFLWDAVAAGDRVRARLSFRNPGGTSVVRIGLEPGTLVRDVTIPGTVDVGWEGTASRPEWVARITPPLPEGAAVLLDVWRPLTTVADTFSGAQPQPKPRTLPLVEPRGVERFNGTLGFRRPPEWSGGVVAATGAEAISEEVFVRSWGTLPDEPLTLSGAIRLPTAPGRGSSVGVATGPLPSRWRVQSTVLLKVEPGRINVLAEAELSETDGPAHEAKADLPGGFRLIGVEANGLTDWALNPDQTVSMRFDGVPARVRRARVRGWVPVEADSRAAPDLSREAVVPWLNWANGSEQGGTLVVSAPTPVRLVGPEGASVVSSEQPGFGAAGGSPLRVTYRVKRPGDLGRMRWEALPPRVKVTIDGQMTVGPDSAEWVASIRYDVWGGPLDAINLKLTNDWAAGSVVRLEGTSHQQVSETLDDFTYWSIRPERAVWGPQRLIVRSSLPFPAGSVRAFPDLSPLGRGEADAHLRVVNATRQPMTFENSSGLQPVAASAIPQDPVLAALTLRGASTNSYHVVRPNWSLRVQKAKASAGIEGAPPEPRVDQARLVSSLSADGSVLGLARYEVAPGGGPFLAVGLETRSQALWASVNGAPAVPFRDEPGRWLIPLADAGKSRVMLIWRTSASASGTVFFGLLPLPTVGRGIVPTVVSVYAPEGVEVTSRSGRLTPTRIDRAVLEEAESLRTQTTGALGSLDRTSRKDREDLVAALVRFRLLLRQAERAAGWGPLASDVEREARLSQVRLSTHRLREELNSAVRKAGLNDLDTASRVVLGIAAGGPQPSTLPTPEPPTTVTVRPLGRPHLFAGELGPASPMEGLVWKTTPDDSTADRPWLWALVAVAAAAPPAAAFAAKGGSGRRRSRATLAAVLILTALGAGAWGLALGIGLAVAGRMTAPVVVPQ